MSTLLCHRLLRSTVCFFIPTLLLSQVIIRERVEIKPKSPDKGTTKLQPLAHTADASDRFYNPPLFVLEPLWQRMGLTLPSTVTISGTVEITGPIGGNQRASIVYIDPFGTEHEIAWKGREPIGWGGKMYEGQSPCTGTLDKGSFPHISLYLFDGQWSTRLGEVTMGDNTLTFNFNGLLYQGTFPAVPVTATATVTGSFLPDVLFDHWEVLAEDMTVTGLDSTWVRFAPMDGTAGASDGDGIPMESLYRPWGISPSEAGITARVDAKGEYAFLAYREYVEDGDAVYHSGKELTMSLMYTPFLVYDESRGTFDGPRDTVYVTVTGGGKTKTVPVILKKTQILLGETKYFYVAVVNGRPTIKETDSTSEPEDQMPDFEWGDEPVRIVESGPNSGKRLGVYWEKRKPDGTNLPSGMIRLVGRYWHADSLYKVRLIATGAYETVSLVVGVRKPENLGNSPFARSRDRGIDINGESYSVDSVCITWGGIYGFPPQNIKGQYQSESVFDPALRAYMPAYRYEPWSAEFWDEVQRLRTTSHFWVTHGSMGDGDAVPDHQNLRYMTYVNTPHSVWYFIEQYSTVVHDNPPAGYSLFGSFHPSDGRLTFRYLRPRELYRQVRTPIYIRLGLDTLAQNLQANQLARQRFIQYASTQYLGGLNNRPAQSRIASSYGPLQPMYTTALNRAYPDGTHERPENLNDLNVFFPFAMAHHVILLTQQVGDINSNNWEAGFEETMRRVYHEWNNRDRYDTEVMRNARQYTPVR